MPEGSAKKAKRLGFIRAHTSQSESVIRHVAHIVTDDVIPPVYLQNLSSDAHADALTVQRAAGASLFITVPKIKYHWEIGNPGAPIIHTFGELLRPDGINELRVILTSSGILFEDPTIYEKEISNLISINLSAATEDPEFSPSAGYPQTINSTMKGSDALRYMRAFFLDIAIANSEPYKTTISKYLTAKSLSSLFKLKVEFAIEEGLTSPRFGSPSHTDQYVSFSSFALEGSLVNGKKCLYLWDKFIEMKLAPYLPSLHTLHSLVNRIPNHVNQIGESQLRQKLLEIGEANQVMILPFEKPTREEHFIEAIGKYGFNEHCRKNWHNQLGAVSWIDYTRAQHPLVDAGIIEPIKVFVRLDTE